MNWLPERAVFFVLLGKCLLLCRRGNSRFRLQPKTPILQKNWAANRSKRKKILQKEKKKNTIDLV